jgi:hypothetical protein
LTGTHWNSSRFSAAPRPGRRPANSGCYQALLNDGEKQDAGVLVMPHDMHAQGLRFPIAYLNGTDVRPGQAGEVQEVGTPGQLVI